MNIDIDKLTESELIDLNHRVVERLRLLNQMHAHLEMLEFKIGDRVVFQTDHRGLVEGMLTRCNPKTVTVTSEWGIASLSPVFLRMGIPARRSDKVVRFLGDIR